MTLVVREVDLDAEEDRILAVLGRNLKELPHSRRFEWLYRGNPLGRAWCWLAIEKQTGRDVGVAALFPRAVWAGGEIKLCGQVGDFAIDVSHRSLGPAVALQRATFAPVDRGELTFCYDCPPHEQGMATFRRLGMDQNCEIRRHARLLNLGAYLERKLRLAKLPALLMVMANRLMDLRDSQRRPASTVEISVHPGRFGVEFTQLDQELGGVGIIRGRRNAEDLNWRYRDNPLHEHRVLTARRNGVLLAYAVSTFLGGDAYLTDLFGKLRPDVGLQLVEAVVAMAKEEKASTLQAFVSEGDGLARLLQQAGLRYRSTMVRVVAYAPARSEWQSRLSGQLTWSFNQADILA